MLIKEKIRSKLSEVLFRSLPGTVLSINYFRNAILMYHGVDSIGCTRFNRRHTRVKCLEAHIKFLKKYCNVISVSDFFHEKFASDKVNVAITFDDGYANNFKYALPIFQKYQVPSTFYITGMNETEYPFIWADFLNIAETLTEREVKIDGELFKKVNGHYCSAEKDVSLYEIVKRKKADWGFKQKLFKAFNKEYSEILGREEFTDYWKLMSDDEIRQIVKSKYIEIGSHGYYHNNLGSIPLENAYAELTRSKKYLENLIQREVLSIGYPDGSYSKDVKSAAESIGFKYQMAADGLICAGDNQDTRIRNREGIYTCGHCGIQLFDALKDRGDELQANKT